MLLQRPVDLLLDHVDTRVAVDAQVVKLHEVHSAEYAASLNVDGGDAPDVQEHLAQGGMLTACQLSAQGDGDDFVARFAAGGLRGTHDMLSVADAATMPGGFS